MSKRVIPGIEYPKVNEDGGLQINEDTVVQNFFNQFADRTHITGMEISDSGSGQIDVSAGTGWCKVEDDLNAKGVFFSYAGTTNVALTDLVTNYIYLDYNDGVPQVAVDTAGAHFYKYDHIILGCVFRNGNAIHFINSVWAGLDTAHRVKMHFFEEEGGGHRTTGLVTTSTGTRQLDITEGIIWIGVSRIAALTGGFDSSASGTWSTWYYDYNDTQWDEVTGQSVVSNSQYNLITSGDGLANLTSKRYAVHWVYLDQEGDHLHLVYGQGDYTASESEEATVPASLPPIASTFGILIAKIVVQEGEDTMVITLPWVEAFTSSMATNHNLLGSLDGGTAGEYYHMTSAEHTKYQAITATAAELNLLDLAALTAGELLVATGAATAAWQSTGVKLSAPDISGSVSAASALTLPAHALSGNLSLLADNRKIIFGTGSDNEIYHDGTDFHLQAGAGSVHIATTGLGSGVTFVSTNDSGYGPGMNMFHYSTTPAANDITGLWWSYGRDALDVHQNLVSYGRLEVKVEDATHDHADGKFVLRLLRDQTVTDAMRVTSTGEVGGDLAYAEFDDYDDVKLMVGSALPQLCDIGVASVKDDGSGYMLNFQKAIYLGWGGIKQNRAMINDIEERLTRIGG